MVTDITQNVIGTDSPNPEVKGLIGEGIDPHLYKPTRDDLITLQEADVIIYNGLHLEGKMTDTLEKLSNQKTVHALADIFEPSSLIADAEDASAHDPHFWMNVELWMKATQSISNLLQTYDPDNASNYRENTKNYLTQLHELAAYTKECLSTIPANQRVLITAHDAFGYLGSAYNIEVRGIQGLSTESEAGVKDIEALINFIIERQIPAIFVETSVSDKNVRAIIEGCAARGHKLSIGGELFSDAMGSPGTYEGTYIGMIDHNVTTITKALGGTAPPKGLHQSLARPNS